MRMISILGCGWLGFALAKTLAEKGIRVVGTTTSPSKFELFRANSIEPVHLVLPLQKPLQNPEVLFGTASLVIAIPPSVHAKGNIYHLTQIKSILPYIDLPKQLIYVSSTSVYPEAAGEYAESYPVTGANTGNTTLYKAENMLKEARPDCNIVRFGGLMGNDRIPGQRAQKYGIAGALPPAPLSPVNYIHQQDAVNLLFDLIEANAKALLINGVAPEHPTRLAVYQQAATIMRWQIPEAAGTPTGNKRIINSVLHKHLPDFEFSYPNPLAFSYHKKNPDS